MKARKICIVGGTGFVGRHLASHLAREGRQVRILTRHRERHRELLVLPTVEVVGLDVHDGTQLKAAFAGCDAAINLVGILNEKGNNGHGFQRTHVELPRKVTEACRANGITRLLHMSALGADAAYGTSHYLRSKGEGENLVHSAHELEVTSFRPSVIFGEDDAFFNRFAALLAASPYFFPLACPRARFAPVYVGDVVSAFVQALDDPRTIGRRYDLCGPRAYSLQELVSYTAEAMGLKRKIIPLRDGLSRLQARLLELAPGQPFSRDNYLSLQQDSVCEHNALTEQLGLQPTAIEALVPTYLQAGGQRAGYNRFRRLARRIPE